MSKKISKLVLVFVFGMFGGIFADQILWPYFVERPLLGQYSLEPNPVYVTEKKETFIQENIALENAIGRVEKSVVGVKAITLEGKVLEGSGFILTSDGLMVTLAELVPQGAKFSFLVDGELVGYQILKRDLKNNLALIKLEKEKLSTSGFSDFTKLKMGERVFLLGVVSEQGTSSKMVDEGIIKSFNEENINTSISGEAGLAGSPLFSIEGELIGLNTIDSRGEIDAIPVVKIREFVGM
jgi:S1-C subfamily serine protease